MKATELIKELQGLVEAHGEDLEVATLPVLARQLIPLDGSKPVNTRRKGSDCCFHSSIGLGCYGHEQVKPLAKERRRGC